MYIIQKHTNCLKIFTNTHISACSGMFLEYKTKIKKFLIQFFEKNS